MSGRDRLEGGRIRRTSLVCALAVLATLASACGDGSNDEATMMTTDGFVSDEYFRARQQDHLRFATEVLAPGNVLNVLAHMERDRSDAGYTVPAGAVPENAWDGIFAKMAALEDTRDFDALYLLNLLLGYRGHPMVPEALWTKVEAALQSFKLWFTEPTPPGLIDNSYYWTENHEVIYYTLEYLLGQEYPDVPLSTDRRSGREHRDSAREKLLRWFEERARFGFFEWHSNVYYQKDFTPLLTLVEYAGDEDIRTRAAMVLDLLLFDMAMHTHRAAFGVTHGRSYKKDKMTSLDEDTWGATKLVFDNTDYPYQSRSHADAVLLSRARRYRIPEAIRRIGRTSMPFVDRERMGIAIDELAPYEPDPVAPYGFSFTDPEDLLVWWSMGALTVWQVVPITVQTLEAYNLWETTNFAPFLGLRPLSTDAVLARQLAQARAHYFAFGLLKEVNTYTYRTGDYMLSSAIDYRKGSFGQQYHSWQATFDANALVFTNHPFRPLARSTNWLDDPETGGYWNGEASMPRSAQHENVAIHIYAPQYRMTNPPPFDYFRYEPYTHAYFPQDHFDEVLQDGGWTFGRFRDGYIALYSYRPPEYRVYDPTVYATNGMVKPFDLVASGGADNVWIVECGDQARWGSFEAFRSAVLAAGIEIVSRGPSRSGLSPGYDVTYASPSQGRLTFGWEAPFTVRGTLVPVADFPRYDNPFAQVPFDSQHYDIAFEGYGARLDFPRGTRVVTAR
jgi:hypothetical protein